MNSSPVILICGCPLNTGNNGVSALAISTIQGLISVLPDCHILIQHNTGKDREVKLQLERKIVQIEPVFFHASQKFLEFKGLKFSSFVSKFYSWLPRFLRGVIAARVPLFSALDRADCVLDISGGDSFTSIYGEKVFEDISLIKLITIRMKKPLILLPQSYGSFNTGNQAKIVSRILNSCSLISCRDKSGPEFLSQYLSKQDSMPVVSCPDLAFSLEADYSQRQLINDYFEIESQPRTRIFGLNVSGLLYSRIIDFKFETDYRSFINDLINWIVSDLEALLVMVPHVVSDPKFSSASNVIETTDTDAIHEIVGNLDESVRRYIYCVPEINDPRKIKGIIGNCDYFIGSRMHACIGAISQSVPTTCLAYSDKFLGVMQLAGLENCVADMRVMPADGIMEMIKKSYLELNNERQRLVEINMIIKERIKRYFQESLSPAAID